MSKTRERLQSIMNAMEDIDFILHGVDFKLTQAIEDRILKPAIRMNIVKISEQFNKLKDENAFFVLSRFESKDLRGLNAVRNFIAHDYEGVNIALIENVIRSYLPKIKQVIIAKK